jgi:MoaA/NifB/PqqE/SkfB family radical SAM enzyme
MMNPTPYEDESASASPAAIPIRTIYFHITKACNLHCAYCYFSAKKPLPNELTREECARLWQEMVELRPQNVLLTGGEPLLRPDLLDLLRDLKAADPKHRIHRCLNSNGHFVTKDLARQLVGLADEVRVSLDGMETRNDAMRGEGNFAAAVNALETYYSVGFEPKVLVTVTAHVLPDLEELLCFLLRKKFTRIHLNNFRPIGRGKGHSDWRADQQGVHDAIRRAWAKCYPDRPPLTETPDDAGTTHCHVGNNMSILPNGDVFACHVLTQPEFRCGNVREQPLREICARNGLLGALQQLDFRELVAQESQVGTLLSGKTCMGEVYAQTRELPVWRKNLPLIPLNPK